MSSPYDVIFKTIEVAEEYLLRLENVDPADYNFRYIFTILVLLERSIDRQRGVAPPGSSGQFPDQKKEVEIRLGKVRIGIHQAANRLGKDNTREIFRELGDSIKSPFGFGI